MGELEMKDVPGTGDAGESRLRGGSLSRNERRGTVDSVAADKGQDTDKVVRTDDEEDTLYQDGLKLENDSRPFTGINGKDDT
jgi:hypothetical protein